MSNAGRVCAVAGLVALAWAAAPIAEAQAPIRIGASLSQSGTFAAIGQVQLRGYTLCVKQLNDKGRLLGRKLELVPYDDQSDPATAARLYEKLITQVNARRPNRGRGAVISGGGSPHPGRRSPAPSGSSATNTPWRGSAPRDA
jgi:hypothetical protein